MKYCFSKHEFGCMKPKNPKANSKVFSRSKQVLSLCHVNTAEPSIHTFYSYDMYVFYAIVIAKMVIYLIFDLGRILIKSPNAMIS